MAGARNGGGRVRAAGGMEHPGAAALHVGGALAADNRVERRFLDRFPASKTPLSPPWAPLWGMVFLRF